MAARMQLTIAVLAMLVALTTQIQAVKGLPASFRKQMTDIVQGLRILDTPEGKLLKQKLLDQIFSLYATLDKYRLETVTLAEVRTEVKTILKTIKQIQQKNYEQDSQVRGESNSAYGSDNSAQGKLNKVKGDNSYVDGEHNQLVGDNTFSAGSKSNIIGDNVFAIGSNMTVRGDDSVVIGARGIVKGKKILVIDKYNIDLDALQNTGSKFLSLYPS